MPSPPAPRALAVRLSLYYGAFFAIIGVHLPFWPLWLQSRGLSAAEIGLVLASPLWVKVLTNPVLAHLSDRLGERKRPMVVLSVGALAATSLFSIVQGFWPVLAVTVLASAFLMGLNPLAETVTLATSTRHALDYGRIRLWGSLTFIAAATLGGGIIAGHQVEVVLWLILALLGVLVTACVAMPDERPEAAGAPAAGPFALLRNARFAVFIGAASLIQASHGVYYGFGTLHWRALGFDETQIGLLWAEGVVAEILLFAFSGAALARLGPTGLLILAGVAGMVRWSLMPVAVTVAALIPLQALHALTFGATHLAAMHFIVRSVAPNQAATAQSIYSALALGIVSGVVMMSSGALYAWLGGKAFLAMTGLCLVGTMLGLGLLLIRPRR